jgi:hypothetical protein
VHLFVVTYVTGEGYTTALLKQPLTVGKSGEWAYNLVELEADPSLWFLVRDTHVITQVSLDQVFGRAGFVGVGYFKLEPFAFSAVNATGILGIDEFKFNIPASCVFLPIVQHGF